MPRTTIRTDDVTDLQITNADVATGIDAVKLADGSVTNAELQYIKSLTSNGQTQIDGLPATGTVNDWSAGQTGAIDALTSATTITPDMANGNHCSVTLAHNATFANPTNIVAGQTGSIFITQYRTRTRTASWGYYGDWSAGKAPTLTATHVAVD